MNRKTTRVLSAGLAAGGLLTALGVAQPAVAYPPGVGMTVTAKGTASSKPSIVTINVGQAQPGCTITVTATVGARTAKSTSVVGPAGTASFALAVGTASGKTKVTSKTTGCPTPESAATTSWTTIPKAKAPATVEVKTKFSVSAQNFAPGAPVTFIARLVGHPKVTATATANSRGFAYSKISLPTAGTWVIVAISGGKSVSTTIVVA